MSNIFVNGQAQTTISALDRGLLYGDSIFETIALLKGKPLMIDAHLDRLKKGIFTLGFNVDISTLKQELGLFLKQPSLNLNQSKYVLRLTITRSEQSRGYQPIAGAPATRILSLHDWPDYPEKLYSEGITMGVSDIHYAHQPALAGIKHGNRLEQVLAAQSIPQHQDDVVMLDSKKHLISSSKGNLFIKIGQEWLTPDLTMCGINGVTRDAVLAHFSSTSTLHSIAHIPLDEFTSKIDHIEAAFTCNSIMGIVPIKTLLDTSLHSVNECNALRQTLLNSNIIAS